MKIKPSSQERRVRKGLCQDVDLGETNFTKKQFVALKYLV